MSERRFFEKNKLFKIKTFQLYILRILFVLISPNNQIVKFNDFSVAKIPKK